MATSTTTAATEEPWRGIKVVAQHQPAAVAPPEPKPAAQSAASVPPQPKPTAQSAAVVPPQPKPAAQPVAVLRFKPKPYLQALLHPHIRCLKPTAVPLLLCLLVGGLLLIALSNTGNTQPLQCTQLSPQVTQELQQQVQQQVEQQVQQQLQSEMQQIVQILASALPPVQQGDLHRAVAACNLPRLKFLLLRGVNPNDRPRPLWRTAEDEWRTADDDAFPLHLAVKYCPEAVRWLVKHQAGLETKDRLSRTPLLAAITGGTLNSDAVKVLLAAGADPRAQDAQGKTVSDHLADIVNRACDEQCKDFVGSEAGQQLLQAWRERWQEVIELSGTSANDNRRPGRLAG